jgi:predicted lipoprotein with Yx(FWY)xxD motif
MEAIANRLHLQETAQVRAHGQTPPERFRLTTYREEEATVRTPWMLAPTALAVMLIWAAQPTAGQQQPQQATGAAQVTVAQSEQYDAYLADADGRALYLFTTDTRGTGGTEAQSACYDACAEAWPPLLTEGEPQAGEQADAALLGTIERQDGATQVTYNGWPLYYFVQDQGPGETTGQDKHGFGGEWYLVTPEGEKVEEQS